MNDNPKFYKASENTNPSNLIIAIISGLAISIGLGYLYNLFSTFIPFIYFNVLMTIGLGMAIGLAARFISRVCKLNHKKSRLILVVVMALSTFLFQWIAYLSCHVNGSMIGFGKYLAHLPQFFVSGEYLNVLSELYNYGSWSIGSFVFNKFLLIAVWLVELCIITVLPIMSVLKMTEFPFSESKNQWYPKFTLTDQFESMSSKRYFLEEHHKDILRGIHNLKMGAGWRHGIVHIFYQEGENKQYLSFEKVFVEGQGKGREHQLI